MLTNGPLHGSLERLGFHDRFGLHTMLAFLSIRVLRGGPRMLAQLGAFFGLVIFITKSMPQGSSDVASSTSASLWQWPLDGKEKKVHIEIEMEDWSTCCENTKEDVGGGLRVVVFGGNDIATPTQIRRNKGTRNPSWTELLCAKVSKAIPA
jgi:hypothetical protein